MAEIMWHPASEPPERSMEVVVVCDDQFVANTSYSVEHHAFNAHDNIEPKHALAGVIAWTDAKEFTKYVEGVIKNDAV